MSVDEYLTQLSVDRNRLEKEYQKACEWLSSLGIKYEVTRYKKYQDHVTDNWPWKDIANDDLKKSIHNFLTPINANIEAIELIRIKESLSLLKNNDSFIDQIKKVTSGDIFRHTSLKDNSRDFLFELGMASRFINAGYSVDVSKMADVTVNIDNLKLFIECKRLKSEKQIAKRCKEAYVQVKKRLLNTHSKKNRGFISLNLTDLIIRKSETIIAHDFEEFKASCISRIHEYTKEKSDDLIKNSYKHCIGVFCECMFSGVVIEEENKVIKLVFFRAAVFLDTTKNYADNSLLKDIMDKLGKPTIDSISKPDKF